MTRKRLKILWLSHLIPYPPVGGTLQRAYNLLYEVQKVHDIYLLSFNQKDQITSLFKSHDIGIKKSEIELNKLCKIFIHTEIPCDQKKHGKIRLAIKSFFTLLPYTINWLNSKKFPTHLTALINEHNFDLVHFDTISLVPYKKYIPSVPAVLDHHNIESDMMFRRSRKKNNFFLKIYFWLEAIKLKNFEKKNCKKFDVNITCSELDSDRLRCIDSAINTVTIPNGVDIDYFSKRNKSNKENSMVFAGSMSWYPNRSAMMYFATKIWPLIKKTSPELTMHVIGLDPPEKLIQISNSDSHLIVHGFVDDVRPFLEKSLIYICPIQDGGGTKLKILDALSMGCVIVATKIAVEGIDVSENENVILANSPQEFVEKVTKLLADKKLRETLSRNARKLAEDKYSYVTIGEKLVTVFNDLIIKNTNS